VSFDGVWFGAGLNLHRKGECEDEGMVDGELERG
jgi:hypothetical protein